MIAGIADGGDLLEVAPGWARNLVTAFIRIDGSPVGVIANQPRHLGGVLDTSSSEKGARFVNQCNDFGVPMLVLVDTPGFMPGSSQEAAGVIRLGATFVNAFAKATVPRVTVILRKAFGGAFITMNSKDLGADYVFAWPQAEIGVMGARPAVGIIHRRELAAAEDPEAVREELAERYADMHLRPQVAAATGHIDELIAARADAPACRLGAALAAQGITVTTGRVLLTGATGFVGMEVLVRYLERGSRRVTCLVRAESDEAARARLERGPRRAVANGAELFAHRIEAVAGEMTQPDLGLSIETRDRLAAEVTTIVHCAADVSFDQTLENARSVNVGGTRRMLAFADAYPGTRRP